jgi:uncharacterized repeat protein (TIGR03803 family)
MKTSGLRQYAAFYCCITIAGCSQATESSRFQYTPNLSGVYERSESPPAYSVLYRFHKAREASAPLAELIDLGGTLYGTTSYGGAFYTGGTVFSITTDGREKMLHSFGERSDGRDPVAGLVDVNGTLYGTTVSGGAYGCGSVNCGTVFSITTDGTEKVLHSFSGGNDGCFPAAGLVDAGGILYGTSAWCGAHGWGTVFSVTTGGTEKVLHSFGKGTDGVHPVAGLIAVSGILYGTTAGGGAHKAPTYGGDGTVFSITASGTEKLLHSFGAKTDGVFPAAGLIDVRGTLYGTTEYGGAYNHFYSGGTVFSITTDGREKVLHSFGKRADGSDPVAGLIEVNGTLYGTTSEGGTHGCGSVDCGTVFSITTSGRENVLHSFGEPTDGRYPFAGLIDLSGTLYGTTAGGGDHGGGTVYSIVP